MAAVFPLDTSKPWIFNGVTYEYDATDDRWSVVSTLATDSVVTEIDVLNTIIDQEIANRTVLLDVASSKNNQQDASIAELDQRVDQISANIGVLEFKGQYRYVLEKTVDACTNAYATCLVQAGGDVPAMSECNRLKGECEALVGQPLVAGTFTSTGTLVMRDTEEIVVTNTDDNGLTFDWENLLEDQDYLEFYEASNGDTALFQVIADPTLRNTEEVIRVKFISETGLGDGNFNLQETYQVRVFKKAQGLDLTEADERYQQKPYVVYFEDNASDITPVHSSGNLQNGELWYDTDSLELFAWNNNAWTATARPPSNDSAFQALQSDVDDIRQAAVIDAQRLNSLITDTLLESNIYYSDGPPVGDSTGTLRNGDLWIDSDDLQIKFYSGGAWINPDRQVGGDYVDQTIYASKIAELEARITALGG